MTMPSFCAAGDTRLQKLVRLKLGGRDTLSERNEAEENKKGGGEGEERKKKINFQIGKNNSSRVDQGFNDAADFGKCMDQQRPRRQRRRKIRPGTRERRDNNVKKKRMPVT